MGSQKSIEQPSSREPMAGPIFTKSEIEALIKAALPTAKVTVSGDGTHSSEGPRMILLDVVIFAVAYASNPVPQFLIILPPVETIEVTERSTGPG